MMPGERNASKRKSTQEATVLTKNHDDPETFHDAVEGGSHPTKPASHGTSNEPLETLNSTVDEDVSVASAKPQNENKKQETSPKDLHDGAKTSTSSTMHPDEEYHEIVVNDGPVILTDVANEPPKQPETPQSPQMQRPDAKRSASSQAKPTVSEWSHQQLAPPVDNEDSDKEEEEWQSMPAFAKHAIYDDDTGKIIADEMPDEMDDALGYGTLGGAAKGYTRVQVDEDAQSATSMDDNTAYLFSEPKGASHGIYEDDEELRDALSQLQATKTLLTEGQRIAYVGVVRLAIADMLATLQKTEKTRGSKKEIELAAESMLLWSQKMMVRLYGHMEVDTAEQVMIEQLADHGLHAGDLTPTLLVNARVKNPNFDEELANGTSGSSESVENSVAERKSAKDDATQEPGSETTLSEHETPRQGEAVNDVADEKNDPVSKGTPSDASKTVISQERAVNGSDEEGTGGTDTTLKKGKLPDASSVTSTRSSLDAPPPYSKDSQEQINAVQNPNELTQTPNIDIDIRWTVLCDLFLVLISDSNYDARSRVLLEQVGSFLQVPWIDICRFEKRVSDALEMEEEVAQESWDEKAHMEKRRKEAMKKRIMYMGLATVGGSLIIGLSAGLLAPVIGAGLAAGFTTIGVTGTSTFLAGAGGAALVTTTGLITGGTIGVRASSRRTGAVKTFEYRPLHNNKRVNLIVTVAGWMTGNIDDVRLPFSTIDPIMGDIYSIHWEPEMLRSMGDTINILATEALTQGLQQLLGSTILVALMAAIQLPVVLTKLSYLIDNPWAVSLTRADQAGLILADSLLERNLGFRPITLVGFSIGCRLIFTALKELARKGAVGIVQNVYLFGSPIVIKKDEYLRVRTIVSGRFVNGYATNDWILGYLFRATGGGIYPVAGLSKVDIPGIENFDVTEDVPGHMSYRAAMPKLMRKVGWLVENLEFTEIEDPDPENHEKRQRELINEIEEARKELEQKPEKKRFGIFSTSKKKLEKKSWETYDERMKGGTENDKDDTTNGTEIPGGMLFDVDAIRAEAADLAAQGFEIKQLESTMPTMKIDLNSPYLASNEAATRSAPVILPPQKSPDRRASPSPARSHQYHEEDIGDASQSHGDDNISMTFEPPPRISMDPPLTDSRFSSRQHSPAPARPQLMSSHSTPQSGLSFDRNVWADDEGEKDVHMTFE